MITIQEHQRINPEWKPAAFSVKGNLNNKAFLSKFKEENNFKNEGLALDYIMQLAQAMLAGGTGISTPNAELEELKKENGFLKLAITERDNTISTLQQRPDAAADQKIKDLQETNELLESKLREVANTFAEKLSSTLPKLHDVKETASEEEFFDLLVSEIEKLKDSHPSPAISHPDFQLLKKSLIINLPALLKEVPGYDGATILLTDNDVLEFLLDYCREDGIAKQRAYKEGGNNDALLFPFIETALKIAKKHGVIKEVVA